MACFDCGNGPDLDVLIRWSEPTYRKFQRGAMMVKEANACFRQPHPAHPVAISPSIDCPLQYSLVLFFSLSCGSLGRVRGCWEVLAREKE